MREKIYIIYHFYDHFPCTVQYMHKVNSNYGLFSTHRRDSFDCRSFELVQFLCSALTGESRGCNSLESEVGSSSRQSTGGNISCVHTSEGSSRLLPTQHIIFLLCVYEVLGSYWRQCQDEPSRESSQCHTINSEGKVSIFLMRF